MTPIRSILMWAAAATGVAFVVFSGHALAARTMRPFIIGLVLLAISALLVVVQRRFARD